ncbi:hypothetical protein Asi02nite_69430 [Asanoa siamensis]|uniref:Uncharacterized protein n=1 Tax=Asanoa siamensis TaxID=926357 RepID=A0ABQ4D1N5_9ACTN|nr:hypothetical protein Asi02nite_69430 [Asanoa siamensis]
MVDHSLALIRQRDQMELAKSHAKSRGKAVNYRLVVLVERFPLDPGDEEAEIAVIVAPDNCHDGGTRTFARDVDGIVPGACFRHTPEVVGATADNVHVAGGIDQHCHIGAEDSHRGPHSNRAGRLLVILPAEGVEVVSQASERGASRH